MNDMIERMKKIWRKWFGKKRQEIVSNVPTDVSTKTKDRTILLSPTEIFCRLQKKYPATFRSSNVVNMGRLLVGLGVERVRTRNGSAYRVVPV